MKNTKKEGEILASYSELVIFGHKYQPRNVDGYDQPLIPSWRDTGTERRH